MKRLILFEILILFLATTFESDSPPGWFQQVLPVNDQINDIFFLDSSSGWVVTDGNPQTNDTGYIMKTTNSGINWVVQYNQPMKFNVVQFLDANTGYAAGGFGAGKVFKTVNSGNNWIELSSPGLSLEDLYFVNKDTGWICDDVSLQGGLWYTTNGSNTWQPQLGESFKPKRLFFINKDTGWVSSNEINARLFRTTNGGTNWNLQFTFTQQVNDIYFFNKLTGIVSSGFNYITTDGGFNWVLTNDGGIKLSFANDTIGWAGSNFNRIMKTTTGGNTWFRQTSPIFDNASTRAIDTSEAWAGGTGLVKTTDGGGPPVGIQQIGTEIPSEYKLYQNYPNPFNPVTNLKYSIMSNIKAQMSNVRLIVYDITSKEITELVNREQLAGTYEVDWNASGYSSGIYFYSLFIDGKMIDTKKMVLLK